MKNYLSIIILIISVSSCNSIIEEDISPIEINTPRSECVDPNCTDPECGCDDDSGGEDPIPPPCYPDCV